MVRTLSERLNVYRITADLIRERPLVGTGWGTFDDAFKTARGESVPKFYDKAHNIYLESALELGVPAAALLAASVVAALVLCVRRAVATRVVCSPLSELALSYSLRCTGLSTSARKFRRSPQVPPSS
jgi:O-antigen ligase